MMKKLLLFSALLLCSIMSWATDFTVDGICYNITSTNPLTVEVTSGGSYSGDIVIPENVEYEGKEYSVTSIGNSAFEHTGLTSVTIPNSVTSIGEWAFDGCDGLTSVTIPESVTSIESRALCNCDGLTTIVVENGNTVFDSRDNCNAIIRTADNELIAGCKNTTIPNSVTSIGESAFLWCCMSSVTIPNSVTTIKDEAFFDCYGLTSMTIPSSVTSIGNRAFQACSSLTSLTIPESVTNIGVDAFRGCSGLTSIIVKSGNNIYDSRDNSNAIIRTADNKLILGCQNTIIPENVTSIGENAFDECGGLVSVTIPNKVTTIEEGAFRKCYNLKSVTIPSSVTNIGRFAFEGCNSLTIIVVDSGNTVYDSRDNCNAIIRTSDNELIAGCHSTIIPNSVTSIGYSAFALCNNLTSITIPNSVKSIGNFAFYYCTGLTAVTIPNSVTSIGVSAFNNCSSLTSVTIPNSVTSIGNQVFSGCGLTEVISMIEEPFAIRNVVGYGVNSVEIPLYVPAGTKEKYENTEGWNVFKNIVETGSVATHQCPDENHPHMIDLGLPSGTKWACCNVGAQKPEDYGDYYAWGEILPKSENTFDNYAYYDSNANVYTFIGSDISGTQYDAAMANWGSTWVMPSQEQMDELKNNCSSEWTTENGVNGRRFTGPNGASIFLPAAGFRWGDDLYTAGSYGRYWSSSLGESDTGDAWDLGFYSGDVYTANVGRSTGQSVRPVASSSSPQVELQDGDLFTAMTEEGVELTYRVISAAEKTCQVGGGDFNVRACDVNATGTVTVPEVANGFKVTTVGGYAFYGCSGLTQINLPETIKTITYCAFENCSGLTSFTIPSSVTRFSGNHQWNGCTGLTSIHIPASVLSMGNHTFANCPNILEVTVDENNPVFESPAGSHAIINKSKKSVVQGFKNTVIPEGITYIESAAFVGNEYNDIVLPKSFNGFYWDAFEYNAVRSITVAEGNTHFDSRNNCNALMETATDKLVKGCANTVIPSETKIIGEWAFAYAYDSNDYPSLKTVVLPEGLTKIENWAFGYCKDLEEVTIPSTVTEIMYNAFVGSDNMKKLVSYIQEPFALGEYAFNRWQNENITLYVPRGTKSLYEVTEGWKNFTNIVEMDIAPVEEGQTIDIGNEIDEDTNLDGNVVGDVYYSISSGDGSYDPTEGCIVVTKPTDDSAIDGKDIFGEDFKAGYTGIVFKVNEGKGSIKVEAETQGNMVLKVKIGNNDPIEMELSGKLEVTFPYNVSEPTYVYIYGGTNAAGAKAAGARRAPSAGDLLKIYGIEVVSDANSIGAIENGQPTDEHAPVYNLNGQRVNTPAKGVYIKNGRKVLVK